MNDLSNEDRQDTSLGPAFYGWSICCFYSNYQLNHGTVMSRQNLSWAYALAMRFGLCLGDAMFVYLKYIGIAIYILRTCCVWFVDVCGCLWMFVDVCGCSASFEFKLNRWPLKKHPKHASSEKSSYKISGKTNTRYWWILVNVFELGFSLEPADVIGLIGICLYIVSFVGKSQLPMCPPEILDWAFVEVWDVRSRYW